MLGQVLLHYRITEKLGAGGMGIVWKALDTTLGREVALKLLPDDHAADPVRVSRFLREARSASALNHPNIVTIYEANTAGNIPFIAMEYIRGETLHAAIRHQGLGVAKTIEIALQLCTALEHAHRAGIIHRDLKPGNIMFALDGSVKVLDFGLAKQVSTAAAAIGPAGEANSSVVGPTLEGTAVGTVDYMSPEQALGEEIDSRSDLFSLGVVLYEMLAGLRPFAGSSTGGALRSILSSNPKPLHELAIGIPPELEAIVMRCLEKQPGKRYASAAGIAFDLRRLQSSYNEQTSKPTETLIAATRRERAPHRRRAVMLLSCVLVLVVAALGLRWITRAPRTSLPAANHAVEGYTNEYDAYRAARMLLDRYDKKGNIDRAISALESGKRLNPKYALVYAGLSEAYLRREGQTPDKAGEQEIRNAAEQAVKLNPDLAAAHTALGMALAVSRESSERQSAAREFRKALELDPKSPSAYLGLAKSAAASGDTTGAENAFKKSIQLGSGQWLPLGEYAVFLYRLARYQEAAENWEKALAAAPDNVRVLSALGGAYHMLDRYDDAASAFQRALEIEPSAKVYTNLGTARFFAGRYADAAAAMQRALDLNPSSPSVYWGNLGDAYRWAPGERSRSLEVYKHAIELVRQEIKAEPNNSDLRASLAAYLAKAGDKREALAQLDALGTLPQLTANAHFQASLAYEILGKRPLALRSVEAAMRQGYSLREVKNEPELASLRADPRFRSLLDRFAGAGKPVLP